MPPDRLRRRGILTAALGWLLPAGRARAGSPGTDGAASDARKDPRLSDEERKTLLLEMHKLIETAADQAVRRLSGREPVGPLTYPYGARLSPAETETLGKGVTTPEAVRAVRKIVASAVAGPVYDLLSMIDGAREPEGWEISWRPFEMRGAEEGSPPGTLHTTFRETYEEWQRLRPDPGWSLETGKAGR